MKKFSLFFLVALWFINAQVLHAVPANPHPISFTQPNGKELTVFMKGDERLHWHESLDGYTLLLNQENYLTYAILDEAGNLQPSYYIATDIEKRDIVANSFLYSTDKKLFYSDMQKQIILKVWEIEDDAKSQGERGVTGFYKTLCAFVQFPEKSMIKTISQFENLFNQIGYTGNGTGSVRDFFKESSYNQFDLEITLCGIYTAPQSESYYAGNPGDGTLRCRELARWLAQQVAAEPSIDFRDYDSDNNGVVDGFHFIFAGVGQEGGGCNTCIWSHKWQFTPAVTQNGKSISVYSCSPELYSGTTITTIGVVCHEMTHAFGAPDFYDTNYGTGGQYEGTGNWDIMAGGSWNGSPGGNRPPHHNMYTKIQFGWVTPITLNAPTTVTNMPNAAENPVAYKINVYTNNEHYLLENRQRIKFDTNIPGDGLIIYHVHNSVGTSGINDTHPQRMYPVCASSTVAIPASGASNYGNINSGGCPFPGTSGKTAFDGTTTPRMFRWNGNAGVEVSDKPITNITHNNRLISFDFMGGGPFVAVTDITDVPAAATATLPLTLTGTVVPASANNQTITWSIVNAGTTGATISGTNTFNTTNSGTATVLATINNGSSPTSNYTKEFTITVSKATLGGTATISGNAVFGQTLTAVTASLTSSPTIPVLGALSYQWRRGTANISGATASTYTLVQGDIGQTINVQITAANCTGTVTSSSTATVTKATQTAPAAPSLNNSTSTSITLNTVTNCEYNRNSGTYQDAPTFTDLTPNTSYPFTQRYKETPTHLASPASPAASFSTLKATLGGTVTISGNAVYGQTLTAVTTELTALPTIPDLGALSYQWRRGTTNISGATASTYALVQADIGQTINVQITAANCIGTVTSPNTATVTKATQTAPVAPTLNNSTSTSITLNTVAGCEYNINGGAYQSSPEFTGLTPSTLYSFTQRYAETPTHLESPASPEANFATETVAPSTLSGTVTIMGDAVFGETLSANTTGLTSDPVIPDLGALSYQWKRATTDISGATASTYTLVQEDIGNPISVVVTASNCTGSVTSNPTEIVAKANQTAPEAPTLADKTTTRITLNEVTGCEYNINGGTYQNLPEFMELTPNTSYLFTQRFAETPTHLASAPSPEAIFATAPLSVEDNEFDKIRVFSYQFSVYIKNEGNIDLKAVEIYDMMGQIVYKGVVTNAEMVITLQVASGIYAVKLISKDNATSIKKVLIMK
jgi:M6 family metalloprotease-like protein